MLLTRHEWPVLIANVLYISLFSIVAFVQLDFEFLLYSGVVLGVLLLLLWKQRRIEFDLGILWGLTVWGFLHLAGGNVSVQDGVLYDVQLIELVPAYHILRYDQVVHAFGFGVATLVCHHLLRPFLKAGIARWRTLALLIVLMGSGAGAINEIIEFVAVILVPETGVGGYENTALDLVFNLIGGILAVAWLTWRRRGSNSAARGPVD
jgi:putative membrane protein